VRSKLFLNDADQAVEYICLRKDSFQGGYPAERRIWDSIGKALPQLVNTLADQRNGVTKGLCGYICDIVLGNCRGPFHSAMQWKKVYPIGTHGYTHCSKFREAVKYAIKKFNKERTEAETETSREESKGKHKVESSSDTDDEGISSDIIYHPFRAAIETALAAASSAQAKNSKTNDGHLSTRKIAIVARHVMKIEQRKESESAAYENLWKASRDQSKKLKKGKRNKCRRCRLQRFEHNSKKLLQEVMQFDRYRMCLKKELSFLAQQFSDLSADDRLNQLRTIVSDMNRLILSASCPLPYGDTEKSVTTLLEYK
jgi:hypothetical protein